MAATTLAMMVAWQCSGKMTMTNDVLSGNEETTIVLAMSSRIHLGYRLSA
jgi:hypothetical protein